MWFRNTYLKTLREYRIAIFGWGIGMGLMMFAVLSAIADLVSTPQARATLVTLAKSFSWIAEPIHVDTPGGYATWKYGFTILVVVLWPILAGSRMLRGEEERGSMDVLLSLPKSRARIALQKLAALWTALILIGLIIGLLTFLAGQSVHAEFGLGGALLYGLNISVIGGLFGSLALFISQFTQSRRTAAGITGGLLALSIAVDIVHRVVPNTEWFSRLSPVYYYNLSKPLIPSYGTDPVALLVLLIASAVLSGAAIWLFLRRDVGVAQALPGMIHLPARPMTPERALPVNAWSLQSVYSRSLRAMAVPTFWWTFSIAAFAAFMVFIVEQTEQQLKQLYESTPVLAGLIDKVGGGDVSTNAALMSFFFVFLPVLLMAFAVTQASRWAADEEDGLQELVLATPQPRLKVILARFGALTTATIIVAVVTLAATALATLASGLALNWGNLVAASLSIIPMGLLIAALGYLFSGWLRTAIDTGLLSFLLVIWFVITFVGPELNWSEGVMRLSPFYYYGTPIVNGLPVGNMLLIIAVTVVALAIASVRFMRKDIAH
jgi:polyether ionophore transport system permease protein